MSPTGEGKDLPVEAAKKLRIPTEAEEIRFSVQPLTLGVNRVYGPPKARASGLMAQRLMGLKLLP